MVHHEGVDVGVVMAEGGSNRGGRGRGFEPEDFFAGEVTGQDRRVTRSSQSQTQSTHQLSIDGCTTAVFTTTRYESGAFAR